MMRRDAARESSYDSASQHKPSLAAEIISHLTMLQQMQPLFNKKLSDKPWHSEKLKGQ
jgi:hypothetical protein